MENETNGNERKLRSVTIRGIDGKSYDTFSEKIKLIEGYTLGEAVTKMMQDVLDTFEDTFPDLSAGRSRRHKELPRTSISNHEVLTISENDLIEAKSRISFNNCELIQFSPDITSDSFVRYVRYLSNCELVRIPNTLPKLLVYSKVEHCDQIEIYDPSVETKK